jgi:hypothetical protein
VKALLDTSVLVAARKVLDIVLGWYSQKYAGWLKEWIVMGMKRKRQHSQCTG